MPQLTDAHQAAVEQVLAVTSDWELGHVRQVERVAVWLFAALHELHGLGPDEEVLLRAGALLHDVGYPINPDLHHKVSARMIRAQLGPPFTPEQVAIIALLARYHRKAIPKLAHKRYRALDERDRRLVEWIGGILRVADGLDRAHDAGVQSLAVAIADAQIEIRVGRISRAAAPRATIQHPLAGTVALAARKAGPQPLLGTDLETDIAGAMRKRNLLERVAGMPVVIRAV